MSFRAPVELLEELRTYLQHFDDSGHLGDGDDVAEIKRRLKVRISELESQVNRAAESNGLGTSTATS